MPFPILVKILSGRPLGSLESRPHCLKITRNVPLEFLHFPLIFAQLKLTCLVTLFDIQNVYNARFARNVEGDFFCDFQPP